MPTAFDAPSAPCHRVFPAVEASLIAACVIVPHDAPAVGKTISAAFAVDPPAPGAVKPPVVLTCARAYSVPPDVTTSVPLPSSAVALVYSAIHTFAGGEPTSVFRRK